MFMSLAKVLEDSGKDAKWGSSADGREAVSGQSNHQLRMIMQLRLKYSQLCAYMHPQLPTHKPF